MGEIIYHGFMAVIVARAIQKAVKCLNIISCLYMKKIFSQVCWSIHFALLLSKARDKSKINSLTEKINDWFNWHSLLFVCYETKMRFWKLIILDCKITISTYFCVFLKLNLHISLSNANHEMNFNKLWFDVISSW